MKQTRDLCRPCGDVEAYVLYETRHARYQRVTLSPVPAAPSAPSHVRAVLVDERDVLPVVLGQLLDEGLLALGEDLLQLRVDLVALRVMLFRT